MKKINFIANLLMAIIIMAVFASCASRHHREPLKEALAEHAANAQDTGLKSILESADQYNIFAAQFVFNNNDNEYTDFNAELIQTMGIHADAMWANPQDLQVLSIIILWKKRNPQEAYVHILGNNSTSVFAGQIQTDGQNIQFAGQDSVGQLQMVGVINPQNNMIAITSAIVDAQDNVFINNPNGVPLQGLDSNQL